MLKIVPPFVFANFSKVFHYSIIINEISKIRINIITTIGRIVSSALLIAYQKNQEYEDIDEYFNALYYMIMTLLSLFSLLFYCIYYSDIRVKAISRIIKNDNKDEIHMATDV